MKHNHHTRKNVTYAGGGRYRPELVDDVPGEEVDVVVAERDVRVANPLAEELVELGLVQPDGALRDGRLVQVELQLLRHLEEVGGVKVDGVLGDPVHLWPVSAMDGLEDADGRRRPSVDAEADVIRVGIRPVLEHDLALHR